jgi:hypothetical protein
MSLKITGGETNELIESLPDVHDLQIPTRELYGTELIGRGAVRYTLEIPEQVIDPVPMGIINGYMGIESAYEQLRHYIASNGKPAFTVQPHRTQAGFASLHRKHIATPHRLLSQGVWGSMRNIQNRNDVDAIDTDQFDLSGHSMGGFVSAYLATHEDKHEHIRSVIFNASAGLEPHTVLEFLKYRIPRFLARELRPAIQNGLLNVDDGNAIKEEIEYIFRHPLRTLGEGLSVGSCNIQKRVILMGELGIKTAMLGYPADEMTPIDKALEHSGHLVDLAKVFPYTKAGHLAPQCYPEEVGAIHFEILDELHGKPNPNKTAGSTASKATCLKQAA